MSILFVVVSLCLHLGMSLLGDLRSVCLKMKQQVCLRIQQQQVLVGLSQNETAGLSQNSTAAGVGRK